MTATVSVDLSDPTPPYEQLRRQLAALIETGQLVEGDRLPAVRQLARDLDLAAGTVARAYRELETAALVQTRRGGGTLVARTAPAAEAVRAQRLAAAAAAYAATAQTLGVTADQAQDALRRAWEAPAT